MAHLAVVRHNHEVGPGRLADYLARHRVVEVWARHGVFPDEVDGAVVLGGLMGAYDTDEHPWLADEKRWIARLVGTDRPVLGICLGSQLLADALGGRAYVAPAPEAGVVEVSLTAEGRRHAVASRYGRRALMAHQDTFDLPPGATLLAESASYPAVFEIGSGLGIQSHPETPTTEALTWPEHAQFEVFDRAGIDRNAYRAGLVENGDDLASSAAAMFGAWFSALDRRPAPSR